MSVIVAFGDSNTWGFQPAIKTRYPREVRWTGVMQRELGPEPLCHRRGVERPHHNVRRS